MEMQGAVCHETLMRVQPSFLTLLKIYFFSMPQTFIYSQSPLNTTSHDLYHLFSKFLLPETTVYFDEENKAKD